ncbi:hypothetical protein JCGZ_03721 [Jatropha curcas]|uniref:Reverse transcriptase zinc-binding domain-containing protein n=1 Tax=Jatropha curcas TaxID=180498 RepID=A0A067L5Q1_JATCU|nr:hypothetical protein JCGZ_03721 [Jatropha curcas]
MDANATVHNLIDFNECCWNREVVLAMFSEEEFSCILRIPLCLQRGEDVNNWIHNKSGQFSVKQAYSVTFNTLVASTMASSSQWSEVSYWKHLWNLHLPSKLKHFFYRACSGQLSIKLALVRWSIPVDPICCRCSEAEANENEEHILLHCSKAQRLWRLSPLRLVISPVDSSIRSWFFKLADSFRTEQLEIVVALAWSIGKLRNAWLFQSTQQSELCVVRQALTMIHDSQTSGMSSGTHLSSSQVQKWSPLVGSTVKINCDAGVLMARNCCGLSFIIRNAKGELLATGLKCIAGVFDV